MPHPFGDLDRPPLSVPSLRRSLLREGSGWTSVEVVPATGSTNADLVAAASAGSAPPGAVLVAEEQTAGRGRLTRLWVSPQQAGLTFSVLVAPRVPVAGWGWLPLLTGLAVVDGVRAATDLDVRLKWPNDVLAPDGRKLAGILAERVDVSGRSMAVVGIGINVTTRSEELPVATATSLALAGAERCDRQTVLVALLRALDVRLVGWESTGPPEDDYRAACSTLGKEVEVELPTTQPVRGTAVDVDGGGRLVVELADGSRTAVAAGDVTHLR